MKKLGGWWRVWVVLSVVWVVVMGAAGSWSVMQARADLDKQKAAVPHRPEADCQDPVLGLSRNLERYSPPQLLQMMDGLTLIGPPDPNGRLDPKQRPAPWAIVMQDPAYQRFESDRKERFRQEYFRRAIAPLFADEAIAQDALATFAATYGPGAAPLPSAGPKVDLNSALVAYWLDDRVILIRSSITAIQKCVNAEVSQPQVSPTSSLGATIWIWVALVIAPPLLLALLGLAIAWVVGGFRSRP
ncbi:hypothetical protein [Dyella sp. Tek66A03]|uniref:hypothetical protein n=1 Tax=Dyella sp. Tek66A03 TaxID=3458298 RepID=UPI00403EABDD